MSRIFSRRLVSLCHLVQTRLASTSSGTPNVPYPFPRHANPSPREIFHLSRGASQNDIKSRYYELVRIHHPDSPTARMLPPSISRARFQAISDAYVVLSGKTPSLHTWGDDKPYEEELRQRTRAQWRASAGSDEFGWSPAASSWKNVRHERDQYIIVFIVIFALAAAVLPLSMLSPYAANFKETRHSDAQRRIAQAVRRARDNAETRRVALIGRKNGDGEQEDGGDKNEILHGGKR